MMLIKIGRHWIDPERIEAVLDGAHHSRPACEVRFQSGKSIEFTVSAESFVDQLAVKRREVLAARPQAPEIGMSKGGL